MKGQRELRDRLISEKEGWMKAQREPLDVLIIEKEG